MAQFHAIQVVCEAVTSVLRQAYDPAIMEPRLNLQFDVYRTEDFKNHMNAGVSLFLYRVHVNAGQRTPSPPRDNVARRFQLPLDLHFFLTVWAQRSSLQHVLLGWAMRVLEDFPVLPASLLNGIRSGVFDEDETVEIVPGQVSNEELMRIWDDLGSEYQLSVPYIARVVRIDSLLETPTGGPVRERVFGMQAPE